MQGNETSGGYRAYVVAVLALVYFFYMVDRSAIIVSQELIKQEFGLSDTQMGLLTGTLYGVSYALAGLPLGWAVDRVNRKKLLAGIVAIWSGLTALSGLTTSFLQLALARIGVGAAESGGSPSALSILSDIFPPERRATVTSLFYAGASVGGIASFLVGGWIAQNHGWRAVFLAFGVPGLLLSLLVLFTIREPRRTAPPRTAAEGPKPGFLRDCWQTLRHPALRILYLATALHMLSAAGVGTWTVPFLTRTAGLDIATVGVLMGLASGVCGLLGSIGVGILADWSRRYGVRGPLCVVAIAAVIHVLGGLVVFLATSLPVVIAGLCVLGATTSIQAGPSNAAISEVAPQASRGMAFALYATVANVVGAGIGPVLVGALSDWLGGDGQALRTAIIAVLLIEFLAAAAFIRASLYHARAVAAKSAA